MENAPDQNQPEQPKFKRRHRRSKPQLLDPRLLDGRTNASKEFNRIVRELEAELGGRDSLSAMERMLVDAAAGAKIVLADMQARLALGENIDRMQLMTAQSTIVRLARVMDVKRRVSKRAATPSLPEYIRQKQAEDADAAA